jgi:hypothetical protein
MITSSLQVSALDFAAATGWDPKPQGMCRGEVCVPSPGALIDGMDNVWALGSATATGRALSTAVAADPTLIDRDGNPFKLSALHGRKVLLVAWSTY